MKKLNYLLASIFLLTSMGAFAQVDIKIEPCVQAKDAISKEDRKNIVKGAKQDRDLPKDFFTEKVVVFILNSKTDNLSNIIQRRPKEGDYNFSEKIKEVKDACKKAGLNVSKYIIDNHLDNIFGNQLISSTISEEDLNLVKKSGSKYYAIISQNLGLSVSKADNLKEATIGEDIDKLFVKVINSNNPLDIYVTSVKRLSKNGMIDSYKEGQTIYRIPETATYGGKYELPAGLKVSKIYFVNNPNLILPKSKPKGFMCKMMYNQQLLKKEKFNEWNEAAQKILKKCKIDNDIVDKESEIKTGEDIYVLKYHETAVETFYLENTITKKVYAFKSGTVSNKYDKYLEKVIKEINEH